MLESKIQKKIQSKLTKLGWLVIRPIALSKSGYPDLFCFKDGRTVFIEVKQPGKKLRKIQEYRKMELEKQGFEVMVVDSADMLELI